MAAHQVPLSLGFSYWSGFPFPSPPSSQSCGFSWSHVWIVIHWPLNDIPTGTMTILLEEEMAPHSSILARIIPRTGEPGGLQSDWLQTVRHN